MACHKSLEAKKQPKIWENAEADMVARLCIADMSEEGVLQWRNDYLCLKSETSSFQVPKRILQRIFQIRNIMDNDALANGLCLYSFDGGDAKTIKVPNLVFAAPNLKAAPPDQQRVRFADPIVHSNLGNGLSKRGKDRALPVASEIKANSLLGSVLRCLSLIQDEEYQAKSKTSKLWHQILSEINEHHFQIEKIPKDILKPLDDFMDPANCHDMSPILFVFNHVVSCLEMLPLFSPCKSSSCSKNAVIELGKSDADATTLEEAIAGRLCCGENDAVTPRVLAVSIECNWNIKTEMLVLDAGKSRRIHYRLRAFILHQEKAYTSYVSDGGYFKVNDTTDRKQWRTAQKLLTRKQAFLLFVHEQQSANCGFSSSKQSTAEKVTKISEEVESSIPSSSPGSAKTSTSQPIKIKEATAPACKQQIKLPELEEALSRIQVCGTTGIAQCAVINLPYAEKFDFHLQCFRSQQIDQNSSTPLHASAQNQLFQNLITPRSLAFQAKADVKMYGEKAEWVFIDELCDKLRTSTGFTHSLQSLELNTEKIHYKFTQSDEKYLNYIADRGMALIHAVQHYNNWYRKWDACCLIKALQLPDTKGATFPTMTRGSGKPVPMLTIYAHLLRGIFAGMHQMPELVIRLPVSLSQADHQKIIEMLKLLLDKR